MITRRTFLKFSSAGALTLYTLNEFGVDPFGYEPRFAAQVLLPIALAYRYWLRVETTGIERVPEGRVLLIANHGGNTFAWDGAMLSMSLLLDAEPPRVVRGMAEYYLPTLPFFGTLMHRVGSVVGTPSNCAQLLDRVQVRWHALGLQIRPARTAAVRPFIPVEPEKAQVVHDRLRGARHDARCVDVLDAQHQAALALARAQPGA